MNDTSKNWRCPHCYSQSARRACKRCHREMCVECISDHPNVGPVCGQCYDEIDGKLNGSKANEEEM